MYFLQSRGACWSTPHGACFATICLKGDAWRRGGMAFPGRPCMQGLYARFLPGYLARIFADFTCLPSTNGSPVHLTCRVWVQTRFRADNSSCKATCKQPPVTRACTCGMEVVPFMIGLPQWICRNRLFCTSKCIFPLKLLHDVPCAHKPVASTMLIINYRQLWLYLFLPK